MSTTSPRTPARLPFWITLGEAYALPLRNLASVFRITWCWAVLLALAMGALYGLVDESQLKAMQEGASFGPAGLNLVSLLLGLIAGSSTAVAWHRLLLIGELPTGTVYLRLDNTVWRYIAVAGLLLLISMPFFMAAFVTAQIAPDLALKPGQPPPDVSGWMLLLVTMLAVGMVAAFLLTTRLALILPARAIDDGAFTLRDSWRLTSGNFWRLFGGSLICYLPTLVLGGLIGAVAASGGVGGYIASIMLSSAAGLVTSVFPLSFLARAYRHFDGAGASANRAVV